MFAVSIMQYIYIAHISQDGCTALYLAAQGRHEDVVELLLDAKADPELKEKVIKL